MSKEAMNLALEALNDIIPANANIEEMRHKQSKAAAALREALEKEALHKLAADSITEGLRLDDWPKIGCVNHDCDKCKAQQDIPDLIAGALGVSRGTAYDMMREALAEQPAQQEPVAWQFFQGGKWHNGMAFNDHRKHTEAAGLPVRDLYPSPQAQPAREPLTFEEWLAKQHGDPEEIGFLQALRIAYIAGQDSITKGNT